MRKAYRCWSICAIRDASNAADFAIGVKDDRDSMIESWPYVLLQATWQAAQTLKAHTGSC